MKPTDVATIKGVNVRTIYRILRNNARRIKIFPRAISEGEGVRTTWKLHPDDVAEWIPGKTKPGKR